MPRSPRWAWYFGVLLVLGVIAVAVPLVYNLKAQLTPEQLEAARALWKENGPADYELLYQERIDAGPVETFRVEVRRDKVSVWRREGGKEKNLEELTPSQRQAYTVPGLFERMERFLEEDRAASRRNYVTAAFDAKDGHPVRYVRRVSGTQERLEWVVEMLQPGK
ncbi:MAG: hypothetical protein HYS12_27245 [Planctomycetes bacterium]|nr:hypothetical protein [Planctomycetota bacterium]